MWGGRMANTYVDHSGVTRPLDKFHYHEMIDRVHCVELMLNTMVAEHPAADVVRAELDAAFNALGALYQAAGRVAFEEEGHDE